MISARDGCGNQVVTWLTEADVVYYVQIRGADSNEVGGFSMDVDVRNPFFRS
jgi:hypothetical protein